MVNKLAKNSFKITLFFFLAIIFIGGVFYLTKTKKEKPCQVYGHFRKQKETKDYFVNAQTGRLEDLIPNGYELVSEFLSNPYPEFLILKKEQDLYSFKIKSQVVKKIGVLKKNRDTRSSCLNFRKK